MQNFYRYAQAQVQEPVVRPGKHLQHALGGGATGIAWNPNFIQKPITSIDELWNPAYKGRVGMMSDLLDIGNFGMIKAGHQPGESGPAGWRRAARGACRQRDAGLVRGYYQQEYIDHLSQGRDLDLHGLVRRRLLQNLSSGTDLRFVIPREGGNMWTDNMMIPRRAQNPVDAMMLMDWYYRPEIAAHADRGDQLHPSRARAAAHRRHDAAKATGSREGAADQGRDQ
jgi:spermidine/putrescine transport system substrate-binding protein